MNEIIAFRPKQPLKTKKGQARPVCMITFTADPELRRKIKKQADKHQVSMSEFIRQALMFTIEYTE